MDTVQELVVSTLNRSEIVGQPFRGEYGHSAGAGCLHIKQERDRWPLNARVLPPIALDQPSHMVLTQTPVAALWLLNLPTSELITSVAAVEVAVAPKIICDTTSTPLALELFGATSAVCLVLALPTVVVAIANKSLLKTSTFPTQHLARRAAGAARHLVFSFAAIRFPVTVPRLRNASALQAAELVISLTTWETAAAGLVLAVLAVHKRVA